MKNLIETATAAGQFTTLLAAVKAAGLTETLSGTSQFTVFAPTDAAFKKLPAGTVDSLLKDVPTLKSILKYHVASGKITAKEIKPSTAPMSRSMAQRSPVRTCWPPMASST